MVNLLFISRLLALIVQDWLIMAATAVTITTIITTKTTIRISMVDTSDIKHIGAGLFSWTPHF